jgi:hypothetical protein
MQRAAASTAGCVCGVTTGNIDVRGDDTAAIYEVAHNDGTIAWYDHEELTPIKA